MTAPALFKQSDITRALRGAKSAGFENVRIVISPKGDIIIHAESKGSTPPAASNEWDDVLQ